MNENEHNVCRAQPIFRAEIGLDLRHDDGSGRNKFA